ncbi:MAG: hypothetical protein A2X94_15215 [Bdellovibrionales bacterium GWB1_55_8]|nr:MAG: hypothetical protein A2X94_15215 [Bdellovibrionales bacterium GWB1_55_8]
MKTTLLIAGITATLLTSCSAARSVRGTSVGTRPKNVIVISIDGLRPEFYLDSTYSAPNLKKMKLNGAYSEGAITVYPSSTFPNHATLATGTTPAKHGVVSNTLFDLEKGPSKNWYWQASHLKVPAIWDVAKQSGKTVAIFGWPVSVGAEADWIVPEIFSPDGIDHDKNWKLTLRETDPIFMSELQKITTVKHITSSEDYDRWMAESAIHVIRKHQPDLTLLHFRGLDEIQHSTGPDSHATVKAVEQVDALLGEVLSALDPEKTMILVVGDHGFERVTMELHLNAFFQSRGWVTTRNGKIEQWRVLAHPNGNQAPIYIKDPALLPAVLASLKDLEKREGIELTAYDQKQLKAMAAFPEALLAVDAPEGYVIGSAVAGPVVRRKNREGGTHGASPLRKSMKTGLLLIGPGIRPNTPLPEVHLVDVAPTLADALGLTLKSEGKPLHRVPAARLECDFEYFHPCAVVSTIAQD